MTVAVIVLNWNGGDDTLACLASVRASVDAPPYRIYVADNGSTDGSLERVRAAFPDVEIVENGANLGFSGGNNRAWRRAAADGATHLLFVNNDAVLAPESLARLTDALDSDPAIGAVSARIFVGCGPQSGEDQVWFEKGCITLDDFCVADHVAAEPAERTLAVAPTDLATGCVLLIRTDDMAALGGFDEAFFAYFEDVDLCLRLQFRGKRCVVARDARAWHRVSASSGGHASPLSLFYVFRNGRALSRRHANPEAWRAYSRRWPIRVFSSAAGFSARDPRSGAGALLGAWHGLWGRTGKAPTPLPLKLLVPLARLNRTVWWQLRGRHLPRP